jgi:hypothetical protein
MVFNLVFLYITFKSLLLSKVYYFFIVYRRKKKTKKNRRINKNAKLKNIAKGK